MNIYQILEALKQVEEGVLPLQNVIDWQKQTTIAMRADLNRGASLEQVLAKYGNNKSVKDIYADLINPGVGGDEGDANDFGGEESTVEEGAKFAFANPKQKPGDQVRGTEKATPKKSGAHPFAGRLVGASESAMQEWKEFVAEFGASNPTSTGISSTDPKQQATQIANTKKILDKTLSGTNIAGKLPGGTAGAAKTMNDPKGMDTTQGKKTAGILGSEVMDKLVDRAATDPSMASQLNTLLTKLKQPGTGAQ